MSSELRLDLSICTLKRFRARVNDKIKGGLEPVGFSGVVMTRLRSQRRVDGVVRSHLGPSLKHVNASVPDVVALEKQGFLEFFAGHRLLHSLLGNLIARGLALLHLLNKLVSYRGDPRPTNHLVLLLHH